MPVQIRMRISNGMIEAMELHTVSAYHHRDEKPRSRAKESPCVDYCCHAEEDYEDYCCTHGWVVFVGFPACCCGHIGGF